MSDPSLDPADEKLFSKLRDVMVDSAWGALADLGFPDTFINCLTLLDPEHKMVGRAITLRYLPIRNDLAEGFREKVGALNGKAVEEAKPGDIIVVDAGGCTGAGFSGDVVATRFIVKGGSGMVVDGAIRDLSVLRKMDLPIYVRGSHAAGSGRCIMGVDYNAPVQCGGVTIVPGDILLGDLEGVLVIPKHLAEEIAERAEATDHRETFLKKKLEEDKVPIYDVYPPSEKVQKEYEEWKAKGN